MFYVDTNKPLPIDIGSPYLENDSFYIFGEFGYPKTYCYDTRIKAIKKIIEIESRLYHYRKVWSPLYYHKLPIEIGVFWKQDGILINVTTKEPITSKVIFNTELEALDYAINHPDPIFLERKKEL